MRHVADVQLIVEIRVGAGELLGAELLELGQVPLQKRRVLDIDRAAEIDVAVKPLIYRRDAAVEPAVAVVVRAEAQRVFAAAFYFAVRAVAIRIRGITRGRDLVAACRDYEEAVLRRQADVA